MTKIYFLIALVLIIYSCNGNNGKNVQYDIHVKRLNAINKIKFDNEVLIKNISYTNLSSTDSNSFFTEINKILIKNNQIYILDASGQHFVYIFNMDGTFIQRIGKKGKGPGEYIRLSDFNVDEKGNVYLLDRQKMRIIIYDYQGKLLDDKKMPFRADAFNLLNGGDYIFSTEKNSSKPVNNSKVIITDSSFNIKSRFFSYDKDCLDDKGNYNIFRETKSGILYNKPVNDTIFLFNNNGEIIDALYFDFGKKTVPQALKNSYAKLAIERKKTDFEYFIQPPLLIKSYIIGIMMSGQTKAFMLYDLNNNKVFQHEISEKKFNYKNINFPLSIVNDSIVVSYLDPEFYEVISKKSDLSSNIQSHLKNGGTVLSFYTIK